MKLTKAVIDKLPIPADGYALYRDDELPGFGVRVTHAGVKSFFLEKRIHRKVKRLALGRYGVLTAEQARREAVKLLGRIASGGDPVADKAQAELESITLAEAFEGYLEAKKSLKPLTIADMRQAMKGFQDWLKKPLLSISHDMVAKRHRQLGEASQARANLAMRYLRAIINFAIAEYTDSKGKPLLTDNPVKKLSQTQVWYRVDRRQTVIKPHQLGPWMQAVLSLDNTRARDYFLLVLLTGLRRTEALSLRWQDVDLAGKTLTALDTKNHQDHTLPLSDHLLELLRARQRETVGEYVFEGPQGRLSNLRYAAMAGIIEQSGVTFTIHDLRRTFATVADSLDIPGYAVKMLLNRKQASDVTAGYIVADVERLRGPMQRITDYILKCAGVRESAEVMEFKQAR